MAAFKGLGYEAASDTPLAYAGLGRRVLGRGESEVESVNRHIAQALRGFNLEAVPAEALLVMRVLGLLSGLSARLGRSGPVMPAWRPYAEDETEAAAG